MVAFGGESLANGIWMQQVIACMLYFFGFGDDGKNAIVSIVLIIL
jgi:hypothetical protein